MPRSMMMRELKNRPRTIPKESYLIIIGAMKCGTTSLFDYLSGHPQICPSSVKEPEYFSRHQSHKQQLSHYEDLWDFDPNVHKFAMEASTGYTKYPQEQCVAKRIYEFGIQPKFLYIIRNPVDRIESHLNYADQRNKPWWLDATSTHLIELCKYYTQLQQFADYFDKRQFMILDFDDLKSDPIAMMRRIYSFAGLVDSWFPSNFAAKNKTSLEPKLLQRMKQSKLNTVGTILPSFIRMQAVQILRNLIPNPSKSRLSETEKIAICQAVRGDMLELQEHYNFDVRKWGYAGPV